MEADTLSTLLSNSRETGVYNLTYHESEPSEPTVGASFFDTAKQKTMVFTGDRWMPLTNNTNNNPDLPQLTPLDQTMLEFTKLVNNTMGMAKLVWTPGSKLITSAAEFWAGVAFTMNLKQLIEDDLMVNVIIALKGMGASSDRFEKMTRLFMETRQQNL